MLTNVGEHVRSFSKAEEASPTVERTTTVYCIGNPFKRGGAGMTAKSTATAHRIGNPFQKG